MEQNFLFYKGYPLVRSGDCFYYGYMCEPHVIMIRVTKKDTSGVIPIASEYRSMICPPMKTKVSELPSDRPCMQHWT